MIIKTFAELSPLLPLLCELCSLPLLCELCTFCKFHTLLLLCELCSGKFRKLPLLCELCSGPVNVALIFQLLELLSKVSSHHVALNFEHQQLVELVLCLYKLQSMTVIDVIQV